MIFHIANKDEWERSLRGGSYEPATLKTEGFVHCSTREQLAATANRFFRGRSDLVLLCIDSRLLRAELRFETPADPSDDRARQQFPHVYGPIHVDAVTRVLDFRSGADGSFSLPASLNR